MNSHWHWPKHWHWLLLLRTLLFLSLLFARQSIIADKSGADKPIKAMAEPVGSVRAACLSSCDQLNAKSTNTL